MHRYTTLVQSPTTIDTDNSVVMAGGKGGAGGVEVGKRGKTGTTAIV